MGTFGEVFTVTNFMISRVRVIKFRRWTGHVARTKGSMSNLNILTIKPTGKRIRGRPRRRWGG